MQIYDYLIKSFLRFDTILLAILEGIKRNINEIADKREPKECMKLFSYLNFTVNTPFSGMLTAMYGIIR